MFLFPSIRFLHYDACPWWEKVNRERHGAQVYRNPSTDVYVRHNEYVRGIVPKESLLEFRSEQGWKPLCDFLGVPAPQQAYPHALSASELRRGFFIGAAVGATLWLLIGVVGCAALWYLARYALAGSKLVEL